MCFVDGEFSIGLCVMFLGFLFKFSFRLHGSLTQQERSAIFKAFREAKSGVLLTTVSVNGLFLKIHLP